MTMYNITGPVSLSALSEVTNTHTECCVGRVTDTAARGGRYAYSVPGRAEIGLKNRITSGDHVCCEHAAPFVVGRNWKFAEYHPALRALRRRPTTYF
jgi:hypothetical protein